MSQPLTSIHPEQLSAAVSLTSEVSTSSAPATDLAAIGHETPGLVVVPHREAGVVTLKVLTPTGEALPIAIAHSESGELLNWEALASSSRAAAVSGWFPAKLGGWVKLDWRDGGFAADAWTSDGAGMTAYDALMRAKKRA